MMARTARSGARGRTRTRRSPRPVPWADAGILTVLLLGAAATHGAVFGDASGYVAGCGGVLIGALLALAGARWHWNLLETLVGGVVAYLLLGGPLAVPDTTTHGLPTLATVQTLVVGAVTSWKDLLTLAPPASAFTGPAIVPFLAGLVCSMVAMTIAARTSRRAWALVPVVVLGVVGALWGSQNAPLSGWLGGAQAVIALAWCSWLARRRRRAGAAETVSGLHGPARSVLARSAAMAGGVLVVAGVISLVAAPALSAGDHRRVLRDDVPPPLELSSYASPLTSYHKWMTDQKDTVLFTVDGLGKGERVRLATLDTYDGVVMRVGDSADGEGFVRVGSTVTDAPVPAGAHTQRLRVRIQDYTGYWMPGGGDLRTLTMTSSGGRQVADSLYYSQTLQTAMTSRGVHKGDAYTVTALRPPVWSEKELADAALGNVSMPTDTHVPEEASSRLSDLMQDDSSPIKAMRSLAQSFVSQGFYSDGTQAPSLASHSSGRIAAFLDPDAQMIGDDEQYAVAMALMARGAGYPARVVLGFYPQQYTSGTQKIKGQDAHAWVEVNFSGLGWVAFDPTPPRDKVPQTQKPKPKSNPRPQVMQPPVPPQEPEELDADRDKQTHDEHNRDARWLEVLMLAAKVAGILGLICLPFVIIVVAKTFRRRRRRQAERVVDRATGAWDEVLDQVQDLGVSVPVAAGRSEQALAVTDALRRLAVGRGNRRGRRGTHSQLQPGSGAAQVSGAAGLEAMVAAPVLGQTDQASGARSARRRSGRARAAVRALSPRRLVTGLRQRRARRRAPVERRSPGFAYVPQSGSLEAVAWNVDAAVFSGRELTEQEASALWDETERALEAARRTVGRGRRVRARLSPVSLWRGRVPGRWRSVLRLPRLLRSRRHRDDSSSARQPGGNS